MTHCLPAPFSVDKELRKLIVLGKHLLVLPDGRGEYRTKPRLVNRTLDQVSVCIRIQIDRIKSTYTSVNPGKKPTTLITMPHKQTPNHTRRINVDS